MTRRGELVCDICGRRWDDAEGDGWWLHLELVSGEWISDSRALDYPADICSASCLARALEQLAHKHPSLVPEPFHEWTDYGGMARTPQIPYMRFLADLDKVVTCACERVNVRAKRDG